VGIKSKVKYSFVIMGFIVAFVGVINVVLLYQVIENSKLAKDIDNLVYVQENMHEILKDTSLIEDIKKVEESKKRFVEFEHQFETIEAKYKELIKRDFLDFLIEDIHEDNQFNQSLNFLFQNELNIEHAFERIYDIQKEIIDLNLKFQTLYPSENKIRKELGKKIESLKNYEIFQLYTDVKYYSKETLYQYKDQKRLDTWLSKIKTLQTKYGSKLVAEYLAIVQNIGNYTIQLKILEDEKNKIKEYTIQIINENKKHSLLISKKIDASSSNFIHVTYLSILVLIVFIIVFITIFGYKVSRNVGLSVDEIEEKVNEGLSEIKNLNQEIEQTQKEVVFTMGAIGESRSKETGNHVKRVANYSELFALYYGLSSEDADLLKQASPMHDIGKVAIPDAILNKPGRFDDEERKIMNTHAILGYEMLKHSQRPILKAAAIVAYEHHEKWDGSGYPNGTKGEDIHIFGRITAIADVFDALGSDRCYKKAWDDEKIFKLFKEERGKHFEPKLVDIFFENLEEFLKIREELQDLF
jgi:response regulator RpfG family c-di-GMP phosphodiesterase